MINKIKIKYISGGMRGEINYKEAFQWRFDDWNSKYG